ncbi:HAMP domain-containing protein [Alginatibacterium sediminis]|uniref:HAMP domain-containing protein n=1 Tax=Alginatibacterium sediminis TaxID=2164068 RepID=A0A420EHK8_9ALTE|nr:methyl-accepting chemotaxis protein [Alginatibacterium sediminis]RKF20163.1 HAMP domain-containing protein [Alginatibacterium sediminis]
MKSFRQKLLLLILPILVMLIVISAIRLLELNNKRIDLSQASVQLSLMLENSLLVHEIQKERGTTAGYIGAQGKQFSSELAQQYRATDQALENVQNFWQLNKAEIVDQDIVRMQEQVFRSLSQLSAIRAKAQSLNMKLGDALSYYTGNNTLLLTTPVIISDNSSDSHLTQQIIAFYNLLQSKERAGIERAVLSNSFAAGKFGDGVYVRFIKLMTEQESYIATFKAFAEASIEQQYLDLERGKNFSAVNEYRDQALAQNLEADAPKWFKAATLRINDLKTLEDSFAQSLTQYSSSQTKIASTGFWFWSILIIVILTSTIFMASKILKDLNRQVNSIVKVMRKVADDHNLQSSAEIIGNDELSQIARYLNSMIEGLRATMTTLSDVSQELSAAAIQSTAVSSQNASYLDQLHQQTEMITTAVEELSISIAEVSQSTTQTVAAVDLVNQSSKASESAVDEAQDVIQEVAQDVDNISLSINKLHDSSQSISSVLEVIKNIADQTNLLALNAAIEAARAGDQGRGFAVVADEVRTLAQRTQESTIEIEKIVEDFQSNSRKAYEMMNSSQAKVSQSVESSGVVRSGLDSIVNAIDKVVSSSHQVASATEEQSVVSRDIAEKIVEIDEHARETAKGGEEISAAATRLQVLAERVKQQSSLFKL